MTVHYFTAVCICKHQHNWRVYFSMPYAELITWNQKNYRNLIKGLSKLYIGI